jgi:hypothetical protein
MAVAALAMAATAHAISYTFIPNDGQGNTADLWDLDHTKYYTWGFKNITIPAGYVIKSAKLTIENIDNWSSAENNGGNKLYLQLLDQTSYRGNANAGTARQYADNTPGLSDFFATYNYSDHIKIGEYTDTDGGRGHAEDLAYNFGTLGLLDDLTKYIKNGGTFGFGFDPDCHYNNDGVKFEMEYCRAPEGGATAALLLTSLAGLAGLRRKL